ncbi:MAG: excinuclease subunit, partial [Bacteroidales bacterium]|nr:excinuclease subunit [Bacteroidales bacterium]
MLEGHPFEEKIRTLLKTIPDSPGVYQFFDEKGEIIYIGKARNLKKRVSSYFNKDSGVSAKVWVMARKVADIRVIVVKTEMDALLLENNLIKEHQPRYNINLKDDKTYPWLCIKNEPFPRIFTTRNPVKDGSKYYGPYASGRVLKNLLDLIRQLYPRRTCTLNLTQKNIASGRFKPCLEYHIGNCKAPCIGLQSEEEYNANIAAIREIIRGNLGNIMQSLRREMMEHADRLEFEEAQKIKEKLELLQAYQSKSPVVSNTSIQADVFSIVSDEKEAYVNFLKVSDGAVVQSHTLQIRKKLGEADEELLSYGILEFRLRFESASPEIIVPFDPGIELEGVTLTVPQKGDKKQLLELSQSNAEYFRHEKQRQAELVDPERHTRRLLKQVMKDL